MKALSAEEKAKVFSSAQRQALREAALGEARLDLDQIKADIMANDPATYDDYGEYELHGSLKDRVCEIIYNHAYQAASPYSSISPDSMRRMLDKSLFALAKRERFLPDAKKWWEKGLEDGGA